MDTRSIRRRRRARLLALLTAGLLVVLGVPGSPASSSPGQEVTDLTTDSAEDLAQALVGEGISISNVTYTGHVRGAGRFAGMGPAVGFPAGIVLSSGSVTDVPDEGFASSVVGPNTDDGISGGMGEPGDEDLSTLIGEATNDAAVLELDFVPQSDQVTFNYVFGSDEYLEYVGSFNDVFGFFVNGENCATVDGQPVSVNNINTTENTDLFRNNDPDEPGPATIDAQMDGLTTVLACTATVEAGTTNHLKLAIADALDSALDSVVFIEAGSFRVNQPPVAADSAVTTTEGTAVATPLSATDPDGDPLEHTVVTPPAHGTLSGTAPALTYTPAAGYVGPDSFQWTASDGLLTSNTATVSITVEADEPPPNEAPIAQPDGYTTPQDTPLEQAAPGVLANDSDPDGDALTAIPVTGAAHGTVTLAPDGSFTYVPDAGFTGTDTFTYRAGDGEATSAPTTVTIQVTEVTSSTGAISGSIDAFRFVTGTKVYAVRTSDTWLPTAATDLVVAGATAKSGTFSFTGLPAGTYAIAFVPPAGSELVTTWSGGALSRADATLVELAEGDELTLPDEHFAMSATISGRVSGPEGAPLAGVQVLAFIPGVAWLPSATTTTLADGTYSFPDLPTGSYQILFRPPAASGLTAQWYGGAIRSQAVPVSAKEGEVTGGIDATLVAPATVSGSVRGPGGAALAGARVVAFRTTDTWVGVAEATTGADGSFSIGALPPATYQLRIVAPAGSGLATEWYEDATVRAHATPIVLGSGASVTGITIQLGPA
jgi:hypothetical protein